jgi:hypothetical protein
MRDTAKSGVRESGYNPKRHHHAPHSNAEAKAKAKLEDEARSMAKAKPKPDETKADEAKADEVPPYSQLARLSSRGAANSPPRGAASAGVERYYSIAPASPVPHGLHERRPKEMPWLRLQHPGDRMPSLLQKRFEWLWRMGMIYLLTIWWAVSPAVNKSYYFGTWPILANFYGTFVLRPTIGDSVLSAIEMTRGCVIGYVVAFVITELTLALDDSLIQSEAWSKALLGVLTFLSMAFVAGAPYLTKCELQMLMFSVVNAVVFNTYARIQKVHRPESLTLDARYDCWEHPFLELISVLVGMVIGLLVAFFPYGQWAINELRARMEYQSRAISALLRTQHGIALTNSTTAVSQSIQIAKALHDNAAQMNDLVRFACYEIFYQREHMARLRDAIEHFDRQLQLLLSKGQTVHTRLDEGDATEQIVQTKFLAQMEESWETLEKAVDDVNLEVLLSEREHRQIRPGILLQLKFRIECFDKSITNARVEALYDSAQKLNKVEVERHARRMAHLFFVHEHAESLMEIHRADGNKQAYDQITPKPNGNWIPIRCGEEENKSEEEDTQAAEDSASEQLTCSTFLHLMRSLFLYVAATGGERNTWADKMTAQEKKQTLKIIAAVTIAMLFQLIEKLRNSAMINGQGASMLITIIFVLNCDAGSSMRIGLQRMYGSLLGSAYGLFLLSLRADCCSAGDVSCNGAILVVGLTIWGALCGPYILPSTDSQDYQTIVACFTAPIIAVGFDPGARQSAVTNRILAAVLGVVTFVGIELIKPESMRERQMIDQGKVLSSIAEALEFVMAPGAKERPNKVIERRTLIRCFESQETQPANMGASKGLSLVKSLVGVLGSAKAERDLGRPPFPQHLYKEILDLEQKILQNCVIMRMGWLLTGFGRPETLDQSTSINIDDVDASPRTQSSPPRSPRSKLRRVIYADNNLPTLRGKLRDGIKVLQKNFKEVGNRWNDEDSKKEREDSFDGAVKAVLELLDKGDEEDPHARHGIIFSLYRRRDHWEKLEEGRRGKRSNEEEVTNQFYEEISMRFNETHQQLPDDMARGICVLYYYYKVIQAINSQLNHMRWRLSFNS